MDSSAWGAVDAQTDQLAETDAGIGKHPHDDFVALVV